MMTSALTKRCAAAGCPLLLAQLLLLIPHSAHAQQPAADPAARKFYEELIRSPIVPVRSAADIQSDLSDSEKGLEQAEKSIAGAQSRVKESESWLLTHKSEMDKLKDKVNAAKKEKREADKVTLEAQLKQLELVDEYLKKTKAARDSELDLAKAQRDLLSSASKVYQAESDLARRMETIRSAGAQDPTLPKVVLDATQAGENTLKLMKAAADKNQDVAGRLARLADRRIDLAQSRNKLLSEDRIREAAAAMKK